MKEDLWVVHWRMADGYTDRAIESRSLAEALELCEKYNSDPRGSINWIQPDGTEPALKPGGGPVIWRVHYRNRYWAATQGASENATFNAIAQAQARSDYEACRWPSLYHWIQPELAEQPKLPDPPGLIPIHYRDAKSGLEGKVWVGHNELIRQGALWKASKDCGIEFLTDGEKREKDQVWRLWSIRVEDGTRTKTPFCGTVKELAARIAICTVCGTGSYVYSVEREDAA